MPKQRDAETLYFASSRTRGWIDFVKPVTETLDIGEGAHHASARFAAASPVDTIGNLRAKRPRCRKRDCSARISPRGRA